MKGWKEYDYTYFEKLEMGKSGVKWLRENKDGKRKHVYEYSKGLLASTRQAYIKKSTVVLVKSFKNITH